MTLMRLFSSPMSLFNGAARRAVPTARPSLRRPPIGTTIYCNQFRMTVQAGLHRELWKYLVANGWRELPAGESRYRYRALPSNVVAALIDAPSDQWERLLALGFRLAGQTPERKEALAA